MKTSSPYSAVRFTEYRGRWSVQCAKVTWLYAISGSFETLAAARAAWCDVLKDRRRVHAKVELEFARHTA